MREHRYSMETMFEIWDDDTGECIEVGPDRDGLDLVEIRLRDKDMKILARITLTKEQCPLVAEAIIKAEAASK